MSTPIFDEKTIKVAVSLLEKKEETFFESMDAIMTPFQKDMSEEDMEIYDAVKLVVKNYATSCRDAVNAMLTYEEQQLKNKNQMTIDDFIE